MRWAFLRLSTIAVALLMVGCAANGYPMLGIDGNPLNSQQRETASPTRRATSTSNVSTATKAAKGQQLFTTFQPAAGTSCATCHRTDSEERLVGPGLLNVGIRAQTRVKGLSAQAYLHQSIVDPSAYVVEGYADMMPKTWGQVFSDEQIDDLISYLMTLRTG